MTLLTICTAVFDELGWGAPSTIVSNAEEDAVQALALANRVGRELLTHRWEELLTTYTFATVASTSAYDLPSDFHAFANMTQWDRTNYEQMEGPATPAQWQELQSGLITVTTVRWFRLSGGQMHIYPTPTSADTLAFDYWSSKWAENSGGTAQASFTADSDVPRLDEHLFILGMKWRFLKSKGLAYQEEKLDFDNYLASKLEDDGGKGIIRFGKGFNRSPIPDTGFGS